MLWFTRVSSGASVINGLAWRLASTGRRGHRLPRALVILAVIGGLTWANLRGIRQTSWLVNAFTIGKVAAAGRSSCSSASGPPTSAARCRRTRCRSPTLGTAALLLIFAYGGYEVTGIPAGEAANPRRDVPFAFVATILIVTS